MKRRKIECDDKENSFINYCDELEMEYRKQINYHIEEEKKAKEDLRKREISSLMEKHDLELQLEEQVRITADLRLQLFSCQSKLVELQTKSKKEIMSEENIAYSHDTITIEMLKEQLLSCKSEMNSCKQRQIISEAYEAQGGLDCFKYRALHLIENPFDLKITSKNNLMLHQIDDLRNQLHNISKPVDATNLTAMPNTMIENQSTTIPLISSAAVSSSFSTDDNLREEVDNLKKRIGRMKEVIAAQMNRFRDVVYQLTGWNIDISLHENKARLKSRYAESAADNIELLWKDTDKFELLETSFVKNLDASLFAYIAVSNSFPAFLSAVTLNLFDKQTMYSAPSLR